MIIGKTLVFGSRVHKLFFLAEYGLVAIRSIWWLRCILIKRWESHIVVKLVSRDKALCPFLHTL